MRTYILKRLVQIVPTVLMITFVVFVMMRSVPGDPVVSVLGDAYTEEDAIKAREAYGLDKPIVVQYLIWLGKLVRDFARDANRATHVFYRWINELPLVLLVAIVILVVVKPF